MARVSAPRAVRCCVWEVWPPFVKPLKQERVVVQQTSEMAACRCKWPGVRQAQQDLLQHTLVLALQGRCWSGPAGHDLCGGDGLQMGEGALGGLLRSTAVKAACIGTHGHA